MPSVFDWLIAKRRSLKKRKGVKFTPTAKAIALAILAIFIFFVLKHAVQIVHPFIWAIITAYLFAPLIFILEDKTRISRVIWILLVYVIVGSIVYWALSYAIPIMNNELKEITGTAPAGSRSMIGNIEKAGKGMVLGFEVDYSENVRMFGVWLRDQTRSLAIPVFFGFIERLILISAYLIITFYLLLDGEKYIRFFLLMFPTKYRRELTDVAAQINETLGAYIRGQVFLIVIMSAASWIVLTTLRVDHTFLLSISTGILEVVPIIGPIAATTFVSLVAFNQPVVAWGLTNATLTLIVIAAYFALRQMEDLIIIPNVVGRFIHVHPVVVLFALFVGARVGGVLGIFLALPLSAVIKVLFEYLYPKLSS